MSRDYFATGPYAFGPTMPADFARADLQARERARFTGSGTVWRLTEEGSHAVYLTYARDPSTRVITATMAPDALVRRYA